MIDATIWNGVLYMDEVVVFLPRLPFKDFIYENNQACFAAPGARDSFWLVLE